MKQILQHLNDGKTELMEVPAPSISKKKILIQTNQSLLSLGTEKMLVDFGKANIFNKALQQPEKVKQVIQKIGVDGIAATISAVNNKLSAPIPLGYCNVGTILNLGEEIEGFKVGDRVVSNGPHADIVSVPKNLCAVIPDSVSDDQASFVVPGSIALNGIRLAKPTIGENFVIFGLGLIGLLAVQILMAHGCRVLGVDFDESKLKLAKKYGAEVINPKDNENLISKANDFSRNNGVDGVLICASTNDNELVHQAATISRKRGRIILIGTTGLQLSREDFYEKELSFQVSCSYGPGRYDVAYEDDGADYPIGFVRWTEQRNFNTVLQLMEDRIINVEEMISKKFKFEDAIDAYNAIQKSNDMLGLIFLYNSKNVYQTSQVIESNSAQIDTDPVLAKQNIYVSFLGSGQYATSFLMPLFKKSNVILNSVSSENGLSAASAFKKYKFLKSYANNKDVISEDGVDAIIISTRHDSHASLVLDSIQANKHVFVEKPLCTDTNSLRKITDCVLSVKNNKILMVGFNRRFSPHILKINSLLSNISSPKSFVMNINAGSLDKSHWLNDRKKGGGRLIGEACHFIDLLRHLSGHPISQSSIISSSNYNDSLIINLKFSDGSIGVINYFVNGHKSLPKERLEIFVDNKTLFLENYQKLSGVGWKNFKKFKTWSQDKGQKNCISSFVNAMRRSESSPIPFDELVEVAQVSIDLSKQIS